MFIGNEDRQKKRTNDIPIVVFIETDELNSTFTQLLLLCSIVMRHLKYRSFSPINTNNEIQLLYVNIKKKKAASMVNKNVHRRDCSIRTLVFFQTDIY